MGTLALALAEFVAKAVAFLGFFYLVALWFFYPAPLAWALKALAG